MERLKSILSTISADGFWQASQNLPNANSATVERMEGETKNTSGRRVVVTFHRHLFKRHHASWYVWQIDAARFVEPDGEPAATSEPASSPRTQHANVGEHS